MDSPNISLVCVFRELIGKGGAVVSSSLTMFSIIRKYTDD